MPVKYTQARRVGIRTIPAKVTVHFDAPVLSGPKSGELLFEFVREHDHKHVSCELRFHGESYGWEAQYLEGGVLFMAHGAFVTRAAVARWAESMRPTVEHGGA
jgi:hypothetical protein